MQKTKGIYLIVGKSGSGKTTLVNKLRKYGYASVESYTTRPKRFKNETGHTFITEEEFDQLKDICAYVKYSMPSGSITYKVELSTCSEVAQYLYPLYFT